MAKSLNRHTQAQINFHALLGHLTPKTLHLVGHISNQKEIILIDKGNTHSFVQERMVMSLGLNTQSNIPLRIMVRNENKI